jgi:hypothetical protein
MSDHGAATRVAPDRGLEIFSAALMALATVLSAWCAYQVTRWDGKQTYRFDAANAAQTEAVRLSNQALPLSTLDEQLFAQYVVAVDAGKTRLADVMRQRLRPELRAAVQTWLATHPFTNPWAPGSPFGMAAYTSTAGAAAEAQLKLADQRVEAAEVANQHSDDYVLLTMLAAGVLFFSGMGVKFEGCWTKTALNAFGALLFVGTAVVAATFPVTWRNMRRSARSLMVSVCSRPFVTGERCEGHDGTRLGLLTGARLQNSHEATGASVRPGTLWTEPQLEKPWTGRLVARHEVG